MTSAHDPLDDIESLTIIEDDAVDPAGATEPDAWQILLVDDDESLHAATRYALAGVRYRDRRLRILSAFSGDEGFAMVKANPELALILLDVVMESDSAGLDLAKRIRDELGNRTVQIVLRTGQPGHAPERTVIVDYEINDYKSKTELTSERIFTTVMASLRSFEQLRAIKRQQEAMRTFAQAAYRFVPREFLDLLGKDNIVDVQQGDHTLINMTVMFLDVRSFISIAEALSPSDTLEFVNRLLSWGSEIVRKHNGFIDKYLGDGALILFPGCVDDAVAAAQAIRTALRAHNAARVAAGEQPVLLGMGIHFGPTVIGVVGEAQRLEATVIGDVVNSTARLQAMTKVHGQDVLISEIALANMKDRTGVDALLVERTPLRGRTTQLGIYALLADAEEDDRY